MTLRIGVTVANLDPEAVGFVRAAEELGVDSVWVPEFWAADALTPAAYLAACTSRITIGTGIVQLGARTPAMLAMSAMSLQMLTGGRFVLGVGASGPQVMEGWHGVRFDRPVRRTRETIEIIRTVSAGERLAHEGEVYPLPLPGSDGRSIRSMLAPTHIPIHIASLGPANLRLTGELADGWIGNSFMPEAAAAFLDPIAEGASYAGRQLRDLELSVSASLEFGEDVDSLARRHAGGYAFTFGAMGSTTRNFYGDAFARQGYGDDVREVERLWRAGDRDAAQERVPADIGLRTNLLGTDTLIRERLRLYRDAGITTLRITLAGRAGGASTPERLDDLSRLLGLVRDVNAERVAAVKPRADPIEQAARTSG